MIPKAIVNKKRQFGIKQQEINLKTFKKGNQAKVTTKDYRQVVQDNKKHPFNGIGQIKCKLYIQDEKYIQKNGTGSIISNRIILTAAHVIYFQDENKIADQIYFCIQDEQIPNKFHQIKIQTYMINSQYFNKIEKRETQIYDLAFLQLQQNSVLKQNQTLKLNLHYQFQQSKHKSVLLTGYPANNSSTLNIQYFQQAKAYSERDGFLHYKHTTDHGNSGGPILIKVNQTEYEIIGIHKGTFSQYNYGLLLKASKGFQHLLTHFIQKYQLQQTFTKLYVPSLKKYQQQFKQSKKLSNDLWEYLNQTKMAIQKLRNMETQRLAIQENRIKRLKLSNHISLQINSQAIQDLKNNHNQPSETASTSKINALLQNKKYCAQIFSNSQIEQKLVPLKNEKFLQAWQRKYNFKLSQQAYKLDHSEIAIDINKFIKLDWSNIQIMELDNCEIDDQKWRLIINANKQFGFLKHLKVLHLVGNSITTLLEGDIESFKNLAYVNFGQSLYSNPLTYQSKNYLRKIKKDKANLTLLFNDK